MSRRGICLALATLAFSSSAALVQGQTFSWKNVTGNYATASNWTPSGPPTAGSDILVNLGGTVNYTADDATPNSFKIATTAGSTGTLAMTGGSIFANGGVRIGEQGTGVATVNNASLTTGDGSLFVGGEQANGTGTLTLSGASGFVSSSDDFGIGRIGTGTFNLLGGSATADYVTIGKFGTGVWNQAGGLFRQTSGDFEVGDGGTPGQTGTAGPRSGTLNLTGGVIQGSGFLAISNRRASGAVNVSGGAIAVTGAVNNGAIIVGRGADWGGSPGTGGATSFRVTGDDSIIIANGAFEMNVNDVATSSTLIAEITGPIHTAIKVSGDANIGNGSFKVELNGYTPVSGDSWTILSAGVTDLSAEKGAIDAMLALQGQNPLVHAEPASFGSLIGEFKSTDLLAPLTNGLSWNLAYANNSVVLSVTGTASYTADFNDDGKVDGDDLTTWKQSFGGVGADANGDGKSDGADFLIWQQQFGSSVPATAAVGAVPEPASIALVGLATMAMALYGRSRRNLA